MKINFIKIFTSCFIASTFALMATPSNSETSGLIYQTKSGSIHEETVNNCRVTPDLALFELKGPVKSVNKGYIIEGADNGATFDRNGRISSINTNSDGFTYDIKRANNGLIYKLSSYDTDFEEEIYSEITYDSHNRPIKNEFYAQNSGGSKILSYATDKINSIEFSGGGDYDAKSTETFKYLEFDQYGNWTKRECITESTIYKWDNTVMQSNKDTEIQTRVITYYK